MARNKHKGTKKRRNPSQPAFIFSRKKLEGLRRALQEGVEVALAQVQLNKDLDKGPRHMGMSEGEYDDFYDLHYRKNFTIDSVIQPLLEQYVGADVGLSADFVNSTWGLGPQADCRAPGEAYLFESDEDGIFEVIAHDDDFDIVDITGPLSVTELLAWVEKQLAK